jgi:tetratricopeptide (TPR) repeat protein
MDDASMSDASPATDRGDVVNPFVGLRPYEEHEAHLFFGRDGQSDELIRRLARKRFVAVVGLSGSGKSSLVRSGLFAALRGGFMADAGSSWRIALMRPGNAPLASLAEALDGALADATRPGEDALPRAVIEPTLRRSSLGLIEVVQQARLAPDENVLVVVDQFEELFRFRHARNDAAAEAAAAAFVKLLVEAPQQRAVPVYVMLTMRSDFLGDCAQFRGLPEAMNESQYLIPRMNRDERRQAIEGPVRVGGAQISARLVQRLLNDVGEDPDQLPVLQHALMRTWQHWERHRRDGSPLDLDDYLAIGTMERALSDHADEAFRDLSAQEQRIAEKVFKRLTERGPTNREMRAPTTFGELCDVAAAPPRAVEKVIDRFRNPSHSFLTPAFGTALNAETFVDISHESLIRKWVRLSRWVDEESDSRAMYARLADAASRHRAGEAGLWRNPDLRLALEWRRRQQPNAAWARRYGGAFEATSDFLRRSRRTSLLIRGSTAAAAVALLGLAALSWRASLRADEEARRQLDMRLVASEIARYLNYEIPERLKQLPQAYDLVAEIYERNLEFFAKISNVAGATQSTARESASTHMLMGDLWLQRGDLSRARAAYGRALPLYERVARSEPGNPNWKGDIAIHHERMGDLLVLESKPDEALAAYRKALAIVQRLADDDPGNAQWQDALSIGHRKVGDVLLDQGDAAGALLEYRSDLAIATRLSDADQSDVDRRRELAEIHERIARALAAAGSPGEAEQHARSAKAIRESLPKP